MSAESPIHGGLRLWKLLHGHEALWHRTTVAGLEGIHRDGQITPNTGQFVSEYGQARVSYSRHLGGVSLLDFDSECVERIRDHDGKYTLVRPMPPRIFIKIRRSDLEQSRLLLPADLTANTDRRLDVLSDKIRRMRMYVPAIEAIYLGPIEVHAFAGYVLAGAMDRGESRWEEFELAELDVLHSTAASWTQEDALHRAERHARQEYTLGEIIERAHQDRSPLTPEETEERRRRAQQALRDIVKQ